MDTPRSTPVTSGSSLGPSLGSPSRSVAVSWPGAVVSLASMGAITAGWLTGHFPPETPWWAPPLGILFCSDPVSLFRLAGALRKRE